MITVFDNHARTFAPVGRISEDLLTLIRAAGAPVSAYVRENEGTLYLVLPGDVARFECALVNVERYTFEDDATQAPVRLALARDVADLRNALQPLFELSELAQESEQVDPSVAKDAEASKPRILALLRSLEIHAKR